MGLRLPVLRGGYVRLTRVRDRALAEACIELKVSELAEGPFHASFESNLLFRIIHPHSGRAVTQAGTALTECLC